MAADVDFEAVAAMCEGYSGDDMANICRDAAMNAMRTLIAGKTPDQIRWQLPCLTRLACSVPGLCLPVQEPSRTGHGLCWWFCGSIS